MINNTSLQQWKRMKAKSLDRVFGSRLQRGLGCSPFEAEAIVLTHQDVYKDVLEAGLQPGQLLCSAVSVEAPPQARLDEAPQVVVRLTLDAPEDLGVRESEGVVGLRRHRMQRMAAEALAQGGVLTLEDFALRLFNCGRRTLCSDLEALREDGVQVPLRSTIKDMGRTLSHRTLIVTRWLRGEEYSTIARATHHSVSSVRAYVSRFRRIAVLKGKCDDPALLPFIVGVSPALAREYLNLLESKEIVPHRREEIGGAAKKKSAKGQGGTPSDQS